jgi:HEAT repeat protein
VIDENVSGDALIEQALATGDPNGDISKGLIEEVCSRGYPIENLIPLLRSKDREVVRTGAFVLEEVAGRASPLMHEVKRLLGHPDRWVKGPMVDVVLVAATPGDAQVIAEAVSLVTDPDPPMRSAAVSLLSRIDQERLAAALPEVRDRSISDGLGWLIERDREPDDRDLVRRLDDQDPLVRRFAVVAAARAFYRDPDLIGRAAAAGDEEVRKLAGSRLRLLGRSRAR